MTAVTCKLSGSAASAGREGQWLSLACCRRCPGVGGAEWAGKRGWCIAARSAPRSWRAQNGRASATAWDPHGSVRTSTRAGDDQTRCTASPRRGAGLTGRTLAFKGTRFLETSVKLLRGVLKCLWSLCHFPKSARQERASAGTCWPSRLRGGQVWVRWRAWGSGRRPPWKARGRARQR